MKKKRSNPDPLPEQSAKLEATAQAPEPKTKIDIGDFILKCPRCKKPIFGHFSAIATRQEILPGIAFTPSADTIDLGCDCGLRFHGWIYI